MAVWHIGDADRGPDGKIITNPFDTELARAMADVGGAAPQGAAAPARVRYRPGRLELAGIVCGVLLAVALIGLLNSLAPAPAPRLPTATAAPTSAPTAAPSPTVAVQNAYDAPGGALLGVVPVTVTFQYRQSGYPGWAGFDWDGGVVWVRADDAPPGALERLTDLATPTPRPVTAPPVEAPQVAPAAAPCDPAVNPRYTVHIDLSPLGSATGVSCVSEEEARTNAEAQAAQVRAHFAPTATPAPSQAR